MSILHSPLTYLPLAAAFWLSATTTGTAQASPPPVGISLTEALTKARTYSQQDRAYLESTAAQAATVDQAKSHWRPQVSARMNASRYYTDSNAQVLGPTATGIGVIDVPIKPKYGTEQGLKVTQLITSFGKIEGAIASAEAALKLAQTNREKFLNDLDLNVKQAYFAALLSDEVLAITTTSYEDAKQNREIFRKHFAEGRAPRSDVLRLERDIVARLPEVNQAERNKYKAFLNLKILLGLDPETKITLTTNLGHQLPPPAELTKLHTLATTDLNSKSIDLKLLNESLDLKKAILDSKTANYYPTIAMFADYRRFAEDDKLQITSGDDIKALGTLGISVEIPIYQGGERDADTRKAAHEVAEARFRLDHAQDQTILAIRSILADYDTLYKLIDNDEKLRTLASKTYEMSKRRLSTGQTSVIELNDAATLLTQSQLLQKSHLHDLHIMTAQMQAILGNNWSIKGSDLK